MRHAATVEQVNETTPACVHDPLLGCRCAGPRTGVGRPVRDTVLATVLAAIAAIAISWVEAGREPRVLELDRSHLSLPSPGGVTAAAATVPTDIAAIGERNGGTAHWIPEVCAHLLPSVRAAGMPDWMLVVAWRESRCRDAAVNLDRSTGDESYGLFQINTLGTLIEESRRRCGITYPEDLLDRATNVACAGALYAAYGYRPWNRGVYFND